MRTAIEQQEAEVLKYWRLMCDADGVEHDSTFVVFRSNNPYRTSYNEALNRLIEMRSRQARGLAPA